MRKYIDKIRLRSLGGWFEMDVKIREHDELINSETVETIMKAMHSIARGIAKMSEHGADFVQSDAIKEIFDNAHSKEDVVKLSKKTVESLLGIKLPVGNKSKRFMSGKEICDTLLEPGWHAKLQHGTDSEGIVLKNDEVKAIIRAANPKINVSFDMPFDITDNSTREYENSVQRRLNNRRADLILVHTEDGDLASNGVGAAVHQIEKESGWRTHVRQPSSQRGIG
jgi:hypothetical protein